MREKNVAELTDQEKVNLLINKTKGRVIAEFEKLCPTQRSIDRVIKEMHGVFDQLKKDLEDRQS